jgi:hypothetical protein
LSTHCVGYTLYGTYTDGACGTYDDFIEGNSVICGYVPPPTATPTPTPVPPPPYIGVFLSPGGTSYNACNSTVGSNGYWIPAGEDFSYCSAIYSDNIGTYADPGYYSNGSIVKYWDGISIASTASCSGGNVELP